MTTRESISIDIKNVSRSYDTYTGFFRRKKLSVQALQNVSFSISRGELFGLIGPNGAGKTSLIKILSTLLLPTSGEVNVLGLDVTRQERQVRAKINAVFGGDRGLYTRLSAEDNLKYFADLYRVPRKIAAQRIPMLLEQVDLIGREKERVEGYSRGMKQRLHIAKALVNDPEVLFLDEPTIGLDPAASRSLHTIIRQLHARGITILLTSHYMHEVDALCNRVGVLAKGKLVTIDTPYNLKRYVAGVFVVEVRLPAEQIEEEIIAMVKCLDGVKNVVLTIAAPFGTMVIQTTSPNLVSSFLRQKLADQENCLFMTREPTLEDAYLKLVGGEA